MHRLKFLVVLKLILFFPLVSFAEVSVTLKATSLGSDVRHETKIYFYKPGDYKKALLTRYPGSKLQLPEGSYDLKAIFKTAISKHEQWKRGVSVKENDLIQFEFDIPLAKYKISFTNLGKNANHDTRWKLYKANERKRALLTRLGGAELRIPEGEYDIEISYKKGNVKASSLISGKTIAGVMNESLELNQEMATLAVRVFDKGTLLPHGYCRVYLRAEADDVASNKKYKQVAAVFSRQEISLIPGTYDLKCSFGKTGAKDEKIIPDLLVLERKELDIDLDVPNGGLNQIGLAGKNKRLGEGRIEIIAPENEGIPEPGDAPSEEDESNGTIEEQNAQASMELNFQGGDSEKIALNIRLEAKSTKAQGASSKTETKLEEDRGVQKNIEFILDASGSMWGRVTGKSKIEIARKVLSDLLEEIEKEKINVALRVYGTQPKSKKDCKDSKLIHSLSSISAGDLREKIYDITPRGYTPIAYSLEQAKKDLPFGQDNSVVLITDGIESCGGDPCKATADLASSGISSRSYVVGFGIEEKNKRAFACLGEYYDASNAEELGSALKAILKKSVKVSAGSVHVFYAGNSDRLIAEASIGETLQLRKGTYDIVIRVGERIIKWDKVELNKDTEKTLSPEPLTE